MAETGEMRLSGNIVDLVTSTVYPGSLVIKAGKIDRIIRDDNGRYQHLLIPGLIDAHVHIESSMMVPSEFARLAVTHGTVATVSDPHEIANVLGMAGIRYMIENGREVPFKFFFGAPSCVPATEFETAGARIDLSQIRILFEEDQLKFLGELMDYPGVINDRPEVLAKIKLAHEYGKPIDGHAPGLTGAGLARYCAAGISTDHEAFGLEEGLAKIKAGMKILIREGSAAKNFGQLHGLLKDYAESCMFCCDDTHPNDLVKGHINVIVRKAIKLGYDPFDVLRCATLNPIRHYQLEAGLLQPGDPADVVVIDNFEDFNVLQTYVNGRLVAERNQCLLPPVAAKKVNQFKASLTKAADFAVKADGRVVKVIGVIDGELVTVKTSAEPRVIDGNLVADLNRDLLKIAVINRYREAAPAVGFIKNFGLRTGAIASSVAHDSHNLIAVGVSDQDLAAAVNQVIYHQGGLAAAGEGKTMVLPLPVAGLMSLADGKKVAAEYEQLEQFVRQLGSTLKDPYMTLSFMALLVIPELKISDRGLFDGAGFKPVGLFEEID